MARRTNPFTDEDAEFMRRAIALARRGEGGTSPNPLVGAVVVRDRTILGEGWHERAGEAHAEIRALQSAARRGRSLKGASLYVTLEPCSTTGRTPPCTEALIRAGLREVVVAATDPNPRHAGAGFERLRAAGVSVWHGLLADEATALNRAFNHWIVHRTPWVLLKAGMSLDGKIATRTGESRWITSAASRGVAMRLRRAADAILVGVTTVVRDDPSLTVRASATLKVPSWKQLRRVVLDPLARTPLTAKVVSDESRAFTTVVLSGKAEPAKARKLERLVNVWHAPGRNRTIDLAWLMQRVGEDGVTSLLVEGGGETHARFLEQQVAHAVAFFYAPLVIGGRSAAPVVGGKGLADLGKPTRLRHPTWARVGPDLTLEAEIEYSKGGG